MWTMNEASWMLNDSYHATQDSQRLTENKCEGPGISFKDETGKNLLCTHGKEFQ